jgi:hypothetical protein
MPIIQSIPTRYHGVTFRSRLEARWATFFDALALAWEYEKAWFEWKRIFPTAADDDSEYAPKRYTYRYKPDFWLPTPGVWIEVKGDDPTRLEREYAKMLCEQTRATVTIVCGLPAPDGMAYQYWIDQRYTLQFADSTYGRQDRLLAAILDPTTVGAAYAAARAAHFEDVPQ